jgi:uncharacterized protein (DUF952 family)
MRHHHGMRTTFHLVPVDVWSGTDATQPYEAGSLATEGFIHCTDGEAELIATANRHYREDERPFLALTVDLDRVGAPWTIEDPGRIYPHVHGPIDRAAILDARPVERGADGRFAGLGQSRPA